MIIELSVRRELSVEEADGAWRRRWYFSEFVCLSFPDCLLVGSLLISTDCLSVVASSVREHLSLLVRHQTDEFASDFNRLRVRRCFDFDFNGTSMICEPDYSHDVDWRTALHHNSS